MFVNRQWLSNYEMLEPTSNISYFKIILENIEWYKNKKSGFWVSRCTMQEQMYYAVLLLDVWNLPISVLAVYTSVIWSRTYFMFCSSELEDKFAFVIKAFWYCHVQFVSLTGNQRFVSSWTSCVFCWTYKLTLLILAPNWHFVGVSPRI